MAKKTSKKKIINKINNNQAHAIDDFSVIKVLIKAVVMGSVLLPLVFYPPLYDIYDLSKATALRFLTIMLFGLWIIYIVSENKIELPRTNLAIPVLVLLLFIFLSTIFSINPIMSVIGGLKRHEGLPTFFSYLFFFIAAATFFRNSDWTKFETLIGWTTLTVSVYGIFQRLGIDFMNFGGSQYDVTRAFATTGNPVFLGQYLAFTTPFLAARLMMSRQDSLYRKIMLFFATVLGLTCALFTYSRGNWIGIAVAFIFLGILAFRKIIKSWKVLLIFLIISLISIYFIEGKKVQGGLASGSLKDRLVGSFALDQGTSGTRWSMWRSTLPIIAEKPYLGYGLETFKGTFPRYRELLLIKIEGEMSMPDRPHNEPLYLIYGFGLIGYIAFLWIMIAFVWMSVKWLKSTDKSMAQFIVAAGLGMIGYNGADFFSFSTINTTAGYWALIGFTSAAMSNTKQTVIKLPPAPVVFRYFSYGMLVFISILAAWLSMRVFLADYYYNLARFAHAFKQLDRAKDYGERSVRTNPYQSLYRIELATIYQDLSKQTNNVQWSLENYDLFKGGLNYDRRDQDNLVNLAGTILSTAEKTNDSEALSKAIDYYKKAYALDPWFSIANDQLSKIYISQGRFADAIPHLERLLKLDENNVAVLVNFGKAYEGLSEKEKAEEYFQRTLKVDPNNQEAKDGLARVGS